MSQLIETYKNILTAAGLSTKDDGSIFNKDERYFVKGKPLYLPITSVLSDPSVSDKLIFHPLAEAAAKGESDVLEDLRLRLTSQLNQNLSKLVVFLSLMGTGAVTTTFDPEQMKIMPVIKDVSEKENKDIMSVLKATARGEGKKTPLVKVFLSMASTVRNGVKHNRTAVVSFPLYQAAKTELASKEKGYTLLGVTMNKKGLSSLIRILEYIFPDIAEDKAYNAASASMVAPFSDSLFRALGILIANVNEKINLFKDMDGVGFKPMPETWADVVDEMDSLFTEISSIPVQPNADGKARVSDLQTTALASRPPAAEAARVGSVHVPQAPQMHQTYAAPVAPQAPVAPVAEPEFIVTANGVARNPNYRPPVLMGMGGPAAGPMVNDPFRAPMALPNSLQQIPQPQQYPQQQMYGHPAQQYPQQSMYPQHQQQQQMAMQYQTPNNSMYGHAAPYYPNQQQQQYPNQYQQPNPMNRSIYG